MIIEEIILDDVGIYKCVVFNEVGKVICCGELDVNEKLIVLEFIDEFNEVFINFKEGDEVFLEVIIWGKFVLDVYWYKDEFNVRKLFNIIILVKGDKYLFLIYSVKFIDFGVYRCEVKSKMGIVMCMFMIEIEGK